MNTDTHEVKQPFRDTDGFPRPSLHTNGKKKSYTVHRLVATYFGDDSGNFSRVQHIDRDNNRADNLIGADRNQVFANKGQVVRQQKGFGSRIHKTRN